MARFIVKGPARLSGEFTPTGNKNAVLPMIAAAVLTDECVVLDNVPHILDVQAMLELVSSLGVAVEQDGRRITLCAKGLKSRRPGAELCQRVRSSILLAGPVTARHGRIALLPPGGDVIGRRRVDTHFLGLRALGISVEGGQYYALRRRQLRGAPVVLDEASVTATENVLMAAVLAEGETTIFNAACEPHVRDLGLLLNKMGARISGLGTNFLRVEGVKELRGATHTIGPDHVETGSFLAASAATRGELTVQGAPDEQTMDVLARAFAKLGIAWERNGSAVVLGSKQKLRVQRELGQAIPKIEDGPWPAFPSDLMSVAIVLASQAKGAALFFEKMFESRMYFVDRLIDMGAHLIQCDPHRVVVTGPSRLHGTHVTSPDIRAGMAILVAALCARGQTTIDNAQMIDRGYERIDERLRELGADIVRETD